MTLNDQGPASRFGPIANPVESFKHLPIHTRTWLETLSREDVETMSILLVSYRRASVAGWLIKWLFVTAFTVAGSVALFAEQITAILAFFGAR